MIESGKLNLEKLVQSLLWQNDCVILPELGALITRENQAALNPATHIIKPKSKSIFFNPSISKTDGLLANYLTENFGLGYADAVKLIDDAVNHIKKEISAGNKVKWETIGEFFGASDKTFFIPKTEINFLPETFGLFPIQLRPIAVTEKTVTPIIEKVREIEISTPVQKEEPVLDYNKTELQPEFEQPAAIEERKPLMRYLRWPIAAAIVAALVIEGIKNENKTYNFTEKAAVLDLNLSNKGEIVNNEPESKELNLETIPEEVVESGAAEDAVAAVASLTEEETFENNQPAAIEDNYTEENTLIEEEVSEESTAEVVETIEEEVTEAPAEEFAEPTQSFTYDLNHRYHIVVAKTIVREKADALLSNSQLYYLPIGNSFVHRVGIASSNNLEGLTEQMPSILTKFPKAILIDKISYEKL